MLWKRSDMQKCTWESWKMRKYEEKKCLKFLYTITILQICSALYLILTSSKVIVIETYTGKSQALLSDVCHISKTMCISLCGHIRKSIVFPKGSFPLWFWIFFSFSSQILATVSSYGAKIHWLSKKNEMKIFKFFEG